MAKIDSKSVALCGSFSRSPAASVLPHRRATGPCRRSAGVPVRMSGVEQQMKEAGGIYDSGGDEEATSGASNGGTLITPDCGSIEVKLSEILNDGVAVATRLPHSNFYFMCWDSPYFHSLWTIIRITVSQVLGQSRLLNFNKLFEA